MRFNTKTIGKVIKLYITKYLTNKLYLKRHLYYLKMPESNQIFNQLHKVDVKMEEDNVLLFPTPFLDS